ncbi:uncharacterized protein [Rutidosis leptorrhynchoides]|uniref:uncharacterized protein n=1 Tax=Rutidosis leptorrhynchoides TaxID=125765 RepID=UPI003A996ABD
MNPSQNPMFQKPIVETKKKCTFKQLLDCKPPEYSGSSTPTVTLYWLKEIERALEACQCEPELQVTYTSRLLKNKAMSWWDSLTAPIPKEQLSQITWDQFYAKVYEQYCSAYEISKLKREFMGLKMTEQMSIDEVIEQYTDKLRFVQQWLPDEQSRIDQFVEMILPEYRTMVRMATTLPQAFTMAKNVEGDVKATKEQRREQMLQPKQATCQMSFRSKKSSSYNQRGKSLQSGTGFSQKGHRSTECLTAKRLSFRAGSGARTMSVGGSSASVMGHKRKNPPAPEGRAFQMSVDDATATDDVITGMFLINFVPARVLFDSGVNRSFMSVTFYDKLNLPVEMISALLRVEVADGKMISVTTSVSRATIDIDGGFFPVTCLVMPIASFDVVLGMDWLSHNRASIKCHKKIISFPLTDGTRVVARGERSGFGRPLISIMKAKKSLAKGCESFLVYAIDTKKDKKMVSDIPVVFEYPEVFPDELLGLLPVNPNGITRNS